MAGHLGFPIPSPAIMEKIGNRFREDVRRFAEDHHDPGGPVRQGRPEDRCDAPVSGAQSATGRSGVAAIGVAQEFQCVRLDPAAEVRRCPLVCVSGRAAGLVFLLLLWDADFGPFFIKFCSYFPYTASSASTVTTGRNGKRAKAGIGFTAMDNAFAAVR